MDNSNIAPNSPGSIWSVFEVIFLWWPVQYWTDTQEKSSSKMKFGIEIKREREKMEEKESKKESDR